MCQPIIFFCVKIDFYNMQSLEKTKGNSLICKKNNASSATYLIFQTYSCSLKCSACR